MGLDGDVVAAVAALEQARITGRLIRGRDLEVIELQVGRAEKKILEACASSVLMAPLRRMFLPDSG